jgi:hypothetical protein
MNNVGAISVVGVFYSTPFGIVKTYGFTTKDDGQKYIIWYKLKKTKNFTNYYEQGSTIAKDTSTWNRLNISDFPDSVDPTLPYSFDLFFDIKSMSALRRAFQYEDTCELLEMMRQHGIKFRKKIKPIDNQN